MIGSTVPRRLLGAIAGGDDAALLEGLARLQAAELLYETRLYPDVEYTFKHALTHDVAYGSLLREQRRTLHAAIVAALETRGGDEHAEELAHHARLGEDWERAARYARLAADRAATLCADAESVALYERALEALDRLPDTPETARARIDARLALRAPLWRAGRLDRLTPIFAEVEALARRHGEVARLDAVAGFLTQFYWASGEYAKAVEYGERSLLLANARDDLALRVSAHFYMGHARQSSGQLAEARRHHARVYALLQGHETERSGLSGLPYSGACAYDAWCALQLGEGAEALTLLDRAAGIADRAAHLYSQNLVSIFRTLVLAELGRADEAHTVGERALATSRERGFAGQTMFALLALGTTVRELGGSPDGVAMLEECIALQRSTGATSDRGWMLSLLAELRLQSGDLAGVEEALDDARRFVERNDEQAYAASVTLVAGRLALSCGDVTRARAEWEAALSQAERLGMRLLAAHCRLALGRLDRDAGNRAAARTALDAAAAAFHRIGAAAKAAEAEAALAAI